MAHSLGLKAAVGAWLSKDSTANGTEIANLISEAQAGRVDMAIVGSEVLLRGDLTEVQLIGYMNQVRQQIPAGIPVTTADVYEKLLEHPAVISNSDVVLVNYYPYWEGVSIEMAVAALHRWHQRVVAASGGKNVVVSETGWPSEGNALGNAVPSPSNASYYFLNFVSRARASNVQYFYFDALDETWKAVREGPQGAHWGVWDKSGVLKLDMQAAFDGQTVADNWANAGASGGPGMLSIEFTYVPPYGSFNNLVGQVLHVNTDDYKVAVYIYVGGWWTKPTFAQPLTNIILDGTWTCNITTGGSDQNATRIAAYLVPKEFSPSAMSGGQTLPDNWTNTPTTDVNLSAGSYQIYVQTSARQSARSTAFSVQAPSSAPTITSFSWNTTPTANQPLGGTISGTGFVSGGTQVFFCVSGTNTCYQQPTAGVTVNSSTSLIVSNVDLGSGSNTADMKIAKDIHGVVEHKSVVGGVIGKPMLTDQPSAGGAVLSGHKKTTSTLWAARIPSSGVPTGKRLPQPL